MQHTLDSGAGPCGAVEIDLAYRQFDAMDQEMPGAQSRPGRALTAHRRIDCAQHPQRGGATKGRSQRMARHTHAISQPDQRLASA